MEGNAPDAADTGAHDALIKSLVKELSESGEVVRVKGKRYGLAKKMNLLTGTLSSHPEGFGFVKPEKEGERKDGDIFIKARNMGSAMHGDQVLVRLESAPRGRSPDLILWRRTVASTARRY